MSTPAQFQWRKLTTVAYTPNQKQTIDIRKYEQDGVIDRFVVRATGTVATGSAGAGTATGLDNPESLLTNCRLQVTPSTQGLVPINQVTGRTLMWDRAQEDQRLVKSPTIADNNGSQTFACEWHLIFQRRFVKNGIEHALDLGRFTGTTLDLTFGDQSVLFSGSSNVWNFTNVTIELWALISYNVNPKAFHATELFENVYNVVASNAAFLIDNLPNGAYYPDLCLLAEDNGALANTIINSIDLSSGSRSWMEIGDLNADFIQREISLRYYDGSMFAANDPNRPSGADSVITGQYILTRLGKLQTLLTKAPEAIVSQLLIKLNATFTSGHIDNIRLFGRKVIPGGTYVADDNASAPATAAAPGTPA